MTEQRYPTSEIPINVAGAHPKHSLMQWSSAGQNYVVATATTSIGKNVAGHLTQETLAAGRATLRLINAPGTPIGIAASGGITEGDIVTAAAAGELAANGAGIKMGVALETVTAGESFMYRPFSLPNSA